MNSEDCHMLAVEPHDFALLHRAEDGWWLCADGLRWATSSLLGERTWPLASGTVHSHPFGLTQYLLAKGLFKTISMEENAPDSNVA